MRLWRRRGSQGVASGSGGRARRAGRIALFAVPIVATAVVALATTGLMGTLAGFTASITNTQNGVRSGSVGLTEKQSQPPVACPAPSDGQWTPCPDINKYGAANLTSGKATTHTVTLTNTGNVPAMLSLLPSACSDSLTGANGALCDQVTVKVMCSNNASFGAGTPVTLNQFFAGRSFPTGYPMGTIDPGAAVSCTFTLTAGAIPAPGGNISQPIAWKLAA